MKIAVFGATGKTGLLVVEQALAAQHEVIAFTRTPSKLTLSHPHLTVVQGEVRDGDAVDRTVSGVDAVISVLGPSSNEPVFLVSAGINNIISAMKRHGVPRLVFSTGAGVPDANDKPKLINHLIGALVKLFSRNVYEDMHRASDLVRASDLNWTIVRVPMLTGGPKTDQVRVGYVGKGTGPRLSRADMAAFMVQQVADARYSRKAPVISN